MPLKTKVMLGVTILAEKQALRDTELPTTADMVQLALGKEALKIATLPKEIVEGKLILMYPFAGIGSGRVATKV